MKMRELQIWVVAPNSEVLLSGWSTTEFSVKRKILVEIGLGGHWLVPLAREK